MEWNQVNVGDVVRVTSSKHPNAAREGTVTEVSNNFFTIKELWGKQAVFSLEYFEVEVLSEFKVPEPKEIGSVHTKGGVSYVKFSDDSYGWVRVNSKAMIPFRWDEIR
jgi:hypothetical protein